MPTSSINWNHERGFISDERSIRSSRSPMKLYRTRRYLSFSSILRMFYMCHICI
jgi:hypothetical protein